MANDSPAYDVGAFRFFFFKDTATTEIYTLSLHDALPICREARGSGREWQRSRSQARSPPISSSSTTDRKSTRLNSSHITISYAVFCLKKKMRLSRQAPVLSRATSPGHWPEKLLANRRGLS